MGISPENREFAAFLLSDLGRKTMTQNKLSIHADSGDIFYDNHNTEENFYSFLLSQQNEEAAFVPKKILYSNTFEKYITSFSQNFSIHDQEKFDLLAFKNSKYLFYRFNDFVKVYGNPRYRLLHTRKMKDSVALKKIEDKNKQFLVEKIIHDVEFGNKNQIKSEIVETLESNYKVSRRVYQQLCYDIVELFYEYIQSIDLYEQQDIEEDLKINGWGAVENIRTIKDSMRLMNIFQEFYVATGRLPTFNELLVVSDRDALSNEKINLKHLYDLFKNTASHGLLSMPFLGLLLYYFHDEHKLGLFKHATTERYKNLSDTTLSGERPLEFQAISDFIVELSVSIKSFTVQNKRRKEIEMKKIVKTINDGHIFNPAINDPLSHVAEIMNLPNPEHKKTTFPYVEPTGQLPNEIEETQKAIDDDYADLLNKIYGANDVALTQKEQEKLGKLLKMC